MGLSALAENKIVWAKAQYIRRILQRHKRRCCDKNFSHTKLFKSFGTFEKLKICLKPSFLWCSC